MAGVGGALSDVSLDTKLPYLIPSPSRPADCRLHEGGIFRPPERTYCAPHADSLRGRYRARCSLFPGARVPGIHLLPSGGLCATALHLLRRGRVLSIHPSFHRPSDSRIANESCALHTSSPGASNRSTVGAAKLTSERRNLRLNCTLRCHPRYRPRNRAQLPWSPYEVSILKHPWPWFLITHSGTRRPCQDLLSALLSTINLSSNHTGPAETDLYV